MPFIWSDFNGFGKMPNPVEWDGIAEWIKENVPFEDTAERDESVMLILYRMDNFDQAIAMAHMGSGLSGPRYASFRAVDDATDEEIGHMDRLKNLYID